MLLAGLGPLGLPELAIILVIVVLIFGVGRLPEVGGAIGKGIKEFRHATKDDEPGDTTAAATTDAATTTTEVTTSTTTVAPADTAPAAPASDTIFCAECGARNLRAAKFCADCGKPIAAPVS